MSFSNLAKTKNRSTCHGDALQEVYTFRRQRSFALLEWVDRREGENELLNFFVSGVHCQLESSSLAAGRFWETVRLDE